MKVAAGGMGDKQSGDHAGDVTENPRTPATTSDGLAGVSPGEEGIEEGTVSPTSDDQDEQDLSSLCLEEDGQISVATPHPTPLPPPRSDSHGRAPHTTRVPVNTSGVPPNTARLMVDILGPDPGDEETFNWGMQREYLLTCMGFVNGLGCLLQFTTFLVKHGGGVFFNAYVVCMVVLGCPLVYLETTLGQYANGGPVTAWKIIPLFKGLGFCMVCITFLISTFYIMEVTWAIYYLGVTMTAAANGSPLPWDCTNHTDDLCSQETVGGGLHYLVPDSLPHSHNITSPAEWDSTAIGHIGALRYFYTVVLQLPNTSSYLETNGGAHLVTHLGPPVWYLVLCLLLAWVLVYAALIYGPRSIGKVMYLTAPYPFVILPVLMVLSCFNDGAMQGVRFFLSPKWEKLANIQVWRDAAQLVIYTLSLGTGCLHTLAGFTHFHSHCFRNLILICLSNVLGTMFAGFTMCAGLGILANLTNVSLHQLSFTEYELGFTLYPYILTKLSNPVALTALYFSVIIVIGLDSLMVYIQNIVGALSDTLRDCGYRCSRGHRWTIQFIVCSSLFLVGLVFTTQGGLFACHFTSHYMAQASQFIVVLLECCVLMYAYGARKFTHNIEDMTGSKDSPWWMANWKFVSPLLLVCCISATFLRPTKLLYRDLPYPDWSEILGWCLSLAPLICVPGWGAYAMIQAQGDIIQRVKYLLTTPQHWGAGVGPSHDHTNVPDYVISHPDIFKPSHGLAMLTANLYVPHLATLNAEEPLLITPVTTKVALTTSVDPDQMVPQETGSEMTGGGYLSDLMTITSTDSIDSGPENEERGNWRSKLEFVLSCLGYVVGLGNIWRFPYLVYRNGGGAFFIPYLVMLVFCGIPVVYMEMAFGQYASLGPITIWRAVPLFKGLGYAVVVSQVVLSVYYMMVNAWAFSYLFASFTSTLPWSTCNNKWNSDACNLNKFLVTNCSLINSTFLQRTDTENSSSCVNFLLDCINSQNQSEYSHENVTECINWLRMRDGEGIFLPERQKIMSTLKSPSEEFFHKQVLNKSDSLEEIGPIQWQLALYLLLCWVIVFLCLVKGIYSFGKVAYFVVIIPVILLLVLLVCALFVEGHLEGIRFYVTPKWEKVLDAKVWSDAATQVFFSLSACSGGLTTLSSYNKFHNNIYRDAILICLGDTLVSILSGFTVFASMGILANQLNTSVDNVVESNTGLVFVAFPAAVVNYEPAAMWSSFFFLMILMMGLSTMLVITEIIVTAIIDENVHKLRKLRIVVLLAICVIMFLLGLILTTRSGLYILELLDTYASYPVIIVGIFQCIVVSWVYKVRQFCTDIRMMIGRPVSYWWRAMWCVVTPLIIAFVLVSSMIIGVNLDSDIFPDWAKAIGIFVTTLCCLCIPVYAAKKIYTLQGTFVQRVKEACAPESSWGPALVKHWKPMEYYPAVNTHTLSVDTDNSIEMPVPAISDQVDFSTSEVRLPTMSQSSHPLYRSLSSRKPQELRQKAILNHAYSNPQCSMSNGSIDQIKPRLSLSEKSPHPSDVIFISKKTHNIPCQDASTQTDTRSYTLAIKQGSIKSLFKEMTVECDSKGKSNKIVLEVEVTKF